MKSLLRYLTVALVAGTLALSSAYAGECCKKAADAAKKGTACEKCLDHKCCKDAAAKVAKDGKAAKACDKCSKESKKS
jgi:hypothetical protein